LLRSQSLCGLQSTQPTEAYWYFQLTPHLSEHHISHQVLTRWRGSPPWPVGGESEQGAPPSPSFLVAATVKLLLGKDNGAVRSTHPFPEKEFRHDKATPTHDRGHGDPQSFSQYAA